MIHHKIFEIQKQELGFSKDGKNPFFKSNYITLDNIVSTITPILNGLQVALYHTVDKEQVNTFLFDVEDGTFVQSSFPLIQTTDPQKLGSCISYAKRYNLGALLNIITDRDDDGNVSAGKGLSRDELNGMLGGITTKEEGQVFVTALLEASKAGTITAADKFAFQKMYNDIIKKLG